MAPTNPTMPQDTESVIACSLRKFMNRSGMLLFKSAPTPLGCVTKSVIGVSMVGELVLEPSIISMRETRSSSLRMGTKSPSLSLKEMENGSGRESFSLTAEISTEWRGRWMCTYATPLLLQLRTLNDHLFPFESLVLELVSKDVMLMASSSTWSSCMENEAIAVASLMDDEIVGKNPSKSISFFIYKRLINESSGHTLPITWTQMSKMSIRQELPSSLMTGKCKYRPAYIFSSASSRDESIAMTSGLGVMTRVRLVLRGSNLHEITRRTMSFDVKMPMRDPESSNTNTAVLAAAFMVMAAFLMVAFSGHEAEALDRDDTKIPETSGVDNCLLSSCVKLIS